MAKMSSMKQKELLKTGIFGVLTFVIVDVLVETFVDPLTTAGQIFALLPFVIATIVILVYVNAIE